MRRPLSRVILFLLLVMLAREASADVTAFVGANRTPSVRTARGVALGISLLVIGVEFEYSDTGEDSSTGAPSLRTGMFNLQLQTPPIIGGLRFYGTAGGGLYQERLAGNRETGFGTNVGGGIKVGLVGPIGVRFDYRVFRLRGSPVHDNPQRFYVGFNLAF